jgi:alpha-L-rhamnosidase
MNLAHRCKFLHTCLVLLAGLFAGALHAQPGVLTPTDLRVEYGAEPLGIDARSPRLSWRSTSKARGAKQSGYQLQVASSTAALDAGELRWDSGRRDSEDSLFISYEGPALASGERAAWRVRVWDNHGDVSQWSEPGTWEMGLLQSQDWQGEWIGYHTALDDTAQRPVVQLRRNFVVREDIESARLYATARGLYALELNGQTVGDQVLAPGWTSYNNRIQYQTYDVTDQLTPGDNALGALLADGWFRGQLGWDSKRDHYGKRTALRAQLHIRYRDGTETVVATDNQWKATDTGPWRAADIYDGEVYDARRELTGWSTAGYDDADWQPVVIAAPTQAQLVAPQAPPVRRMQALSPASITRAPNGELLVDMGQNMVGWVRLTLRGKAGTEIVLRHAEVLDGDGNLYTENLRGAAQEDRYTLAGNDGETYEPRFTFHGFRYVGIAGDIDTLQPQDITGVVVYSDMASTGTWSGSDALLNQLFSNIVWGQKGNFLEVPTDCPQRDERLGWTGDAQVFAPTAAFNMDVSGFFAKWLADLAHDQYDSGSVPDVIPNVLSTAQQGVAGWADAATVVPWAMYRAYGDTQLLERQYPSMAAWVDYVATQAGEDYIWRPGVQYGDWLSPQFNDVFSPYRAVTGTDLIATAYFAHSADLVARTAEVTGRQREARRYRRLFEKVRDAFLGEFMTPAGRLAYETQTAYVLALAFDLLPEKQRADAARRLADDVRARGNHLTTGFLGTPALNRVLSDHGLADVAYDLLTQTNYPSWLYPVRFGATTIWERWDAVRPDGSFQNPEMTSFNHYAYGAIGQWMVEVVAGLDQAPDSNAYRQLRIAPQPGGRLSHAQASLDTPYGPAAASWAFAGSRFTLQVRIAPNTSASVRLPLAAGADVLESGAPLDEARGIGKVREDDEDLLLELGAGDYTFSYSSDALLHRAAQFSVFDADTPMAAILTDPIAVAHLDKLIPGFNGGAALPASMKSLSARQLQRYETQGLIEAFLAALPGINEARRNALANFGKEVSQ